MARQNGLMVALIVGATWVSSPAHAACTVVPMQQTEAQLTQALQAKLAAYGVSEVKEAEELTSHNHLYMLAGTAVVMGVRNDEGHVTEIDLNTTSGATDKDTSAAVVAASAAVSAFSGMPDAQVLDKLTSDAMAHAKGKVDTVTDAWGSTSADISSGGDGTIGLRIERVECKE